MRTLILISVLAAAASVPAAAQILPPAAEQIAGAVIGLPTELREDARVLGRRAGAEGLVELRAGENGLVCIADDPADERFHTACYHASLEPFMARGRELRAQGLSPEAADSIRLAEVDAGTLEMPKYATLYAVTAASFDPESGELEGARPWYVLYTPYATAESTGLPTEFRPGAPWIMFPGTAKSHIMIVPPAEKPEGGS